MKYFFEKIDELTGSLIALNGDGEVSVENMIIESASAKRLAEALKHGRLEKDIELFFHQSLLTRKITNSLKKGKAILKRMETDIM